MHCPVTRRAQLRAAAVVLARDIEESIGIHKIVLNGMLIHIEEMANEVSIVKLEALEM